MNGKSQNFPWNAKVLDAEATKLCGIAPVEKWVSRDGKRCCLRKLIVRITHLDGRSYMRQSAGKVYEPVVKNIAAVARAKAKNLTGGLVCEGCGTPRANGTAGLCRRCYLNKAKARFETSKAAQGERQEQLTATASLIEFWDDLYRGATTQFSQNNARKGHGLSNQRERVLVHYDPEPDDDAQQVG